MANLRVTSPNFNKKPLSSIARRIIECWGISEGNILDFHQKVSSQTCRIPIDTIISALIEIEFRGFGSSNVNQYGVRTYRIIK